jgi:hypothetical protein
MGGGTTTTTDNPNVSFSDWDQHATATANWASAQHQYRDVWL